MTSREFLKPYRAEMAPLSEAGQCEVLQRAVHDADTTGHMHLRVDARIALMQLAEESLRHDLMIAVYPTLLTLLDETTDVELRRKILWYYRWAIFTLAHFIEPSRKQVLAALSDFENLYRSEGAPEFDIHLVKRSLYLDLRDIESALREQALLETLTPLYAHPLSFSRDQVEQWEGHLWWYAGKYEKMMRVYAPVLSGKVGMNSDSMPHLWATVIYPLFKLGRTGEGDEYFRKAFRRQDIWSDGIDSSTELLNYAVCRSFTDEALVIIRAQLPAALKTRLLRESMEFFASTAAGLRLAARDGQYGFRLMAEVVPDGFPAPAGGEYPVRDLADWCEKRALELAARFDTRNENTYMTAFIRERLDAGGI